MIKNGKGGGNTITGLNFENETDFVKIFEALPGYQIVVVSSTSLGNIREANVVYNGQKVARLFKKQGLYALFDDTDINYKSILSKKLEPDQALYVLVNNTLFIVEIKFQSVAGSVDEKPQTCDFKRKQYQKLMAPLNIEVEYMYIFNEWFSKPEYKDMLDYIISVNCYYYFNYIPMQKLGLPMPEVE